MGIKPERAFGAVCLNGIPQAFIAIFTIHMSAGGVRNAVAKHHQEPGDTLADGWKRAYKRGWRVRRVIISLEEKP